MYLALTHQELITFLETIVRGLIGSLAALLALALIALAVFGLIMVLRWAAGKIGRDNLHKWSNAIEGVELKQIKSYVDEPTDVLVIRLAQQFRQDPKKVVETADKLFLALAYMQKIWPQIKQALDLEEQPPERPPDPPAPSS